MDMGAGVALRWRVLILLPMTAVVTLYALLHDGGDYATPAVWQRVRLGLLTMDGLWHGGTYLALFALFGRTLRPGREALVTGLARRVQGELAAPVVTYTRNVTVAWCWFLLSQPVLSAILLLTTRAGTWWLFINVVSWMMVAGMLAGEYAYRRRRFPGRQSATMAETLRILRRRDGFPGTASPEPAFPRRGTDGLLRFPSARTTAGGRRL